MEYIADMFKLSTVSWKNYILFFDYNSSFIKLSCVCCGKLNRRLSRVDTEDVFGVEESYCIICWWKHILEVKHFCKNTFGSLM